MHYIYRGMLMTKNNFKSETNYMLMKNIIETIATNTKYYREKKNLKTYEVAKRMDTARQSYERLERKETNPTIGFLERTAKALGVGVADLVTER